MRFVFLTLGYHPDLDGGGYRYATEVAERLAARGHEVHAIYPNPKNQFSPQEQRVGVSLHRTPDGSGSFRANFKLENAAARQVLGELVGVNSPRTLVATHQAYFGPATRQWPTVFMYQGAWALEYAFSQQAKPRGWLRRCLDPLIVRRLHAIEGAALARAPRILVASDYTRKKLPLWHSQVKAPVTVVSGGANFAQFQPPIERVTSRAARGFSPEHFVFLTVRRLDPRMGLLKLLDAFAAVARRFPQAQLCLAGRGPQQTELAARIRDLNLDHQARLLGYVSEADLAPLYGIADCTIMPSLDLEGFGLATVESLACGTPVLGSDAGANPELIGPLDRNLLYSTCDPTALPRSLSALLSGSQQLPDRNQCSAYARKAFPWERPVAAFEEAWVDHSFGGGIR